ncbi:MAG TPA: divergent PAP2 family protein [Anaerolineaceae bacterium]|nr:divergent PAP2 family protein [Anaerolineaceae bacterium]
MSVLAGYPELIACIVGWLVSSLLKIPTYYTVHKRINLKQAFGTGGMPSSHAATVTATTLAIGLFSGFDHPAFALAVAVSMIVIYDAAGVRREAGYHAVIINRLIDEYVKGPLIDQKKLKEMIGHTPLEVVGGVISGLLSTLILWLIWPK